MAFGNPYGDEYSPGIALQWIRLLVEMGVGIVSLADTVGLAGPTQVNHLTQSVINLFPSIETGVHLHSRPENRLEKIEAAYSAGCRRFDGALYGIGGCPMAGDDLVGNIDSLLLIDYFRKKKILPEFDTEALQKSALMASEIFLNQ
jgi:hydroxymethylglutaryl-CoA lyase